MTRDAVSDAPKRGLCWNLNGGRVRTGSDYIMVFGVVGRIRWMSPFMTRAPGDEPATATPPVVGRGMKLPLYL